MSERETPSWVQLLTLMVHGPDPEPSVRGAVRARPGSTQELGFETSHGQPLPVLAGVRSPWAGADSGAATGSDATALRVWRDGARVRVEEPGGATMLIAGETTCWQFDRDHDTPLASPRSAVWYVGNGVQLLTRRDAADFAGDDFTRPTGPVGSTRFLGRAAWTVELAPPAHKPYPLQLVVDAETGLVLQQRNDGAGTVEEWVELVVGEPLDPHLFGWDGPARSWEEQRAQRDAEQEAEAAKGRGWFTDHVAPLPLRATLDLSVWVNRYDDQNGAFEATLGAGHLGALARRPRSQEPWDLSWAAVQHRWSTPRWDWAVTLFHDELTPAGLEGLRQRLDAGPD